MKLQQLKYFIEVVLSGSINEAARRLYISQPTLSKAIKGLENELGIVLFIRTSTGISLSRDGAEFLSYARQINEQVELLDRRYFNAEPSQQLFSVSSQHYSFVVDAFVDMISKYGGEKYQFAIRETRTYEIIDDVKDMTSEIGVLYISAFNEKVLLQLISEKGLEFTELFEATPHVFISRSSPLAVKRSVTLEDLEPYPRLAFEQGEFNSFYYSEEIYSTIQSLKSIQVSDRATLFNLLIGLDGYTISTGILSEDLDSPEIVQVPLEVEDTIKVGWVISKKVELSRMARLYLEELRARTQHMR
ncbi:LysR family transcriptional regulator [Salinicoccus sesuvii]|uniref:LysR family transcriptional regulator n=1 Tax=Salinicoccus sesuvii TaxID=868281 RepID=A0ABV7N0S0_9STAP